jgi:hypothetical protein
MPASSSANTARSPGWPARASLTFRRRRLLLAQCLRTLAYKDTLTQEHFDNPGVAKTPRRSQKRINHSLFGERIDQFVNLGKLPHEDSVKAEFRSRKRSKINGARP